MKKLFLFSILILFITSSSIAQVAVVNSKKVVESMSEFAKIDTLVAKETANYNVEYKKKQINLDQLIKVADSLYKLKAKSATTIKAIADAQSSDKDLKAYAEMANKKIIDYKLLLTKPYTDQVIAAIKLVATRAKYMQVLDSSSVNMLYLNPITDITEQVIKELKIK
jgi:Skp family chaperone for outer membrane proteins